MCIFCNIVRGELPADIIYEDDKFIAILDKFPANHGHTLIIPKVHAENLYDLPDEYASEIMPLAGKIARALKKELSLEGLNILQNNGKIAGQTVFHYHMHIIPRYDPDKMDIKWSTIEVDETKVKLLLESLKVYG